MLENVVVAAGLQVLQVPKSRDEAPLRITKYQIFLHGLFAAGALEGDTVEVLPGDRFPVDGVVLDGHTAADESSLTGVRERQVVRCLSSPCSTNPLHFVRFYVVLATASHPLRGCHALFYLACLSVRIVPPPCRRAHPRPEGTGRFCAGGYTEHGRRGSREGQGYGDGGGIRACLGYRTR